jgi:hypothetical protein
MKKLYKIIGDIVSLTIVLTAIVAVIAAASVFANFLTAISRDVAELKMQVELINKEVFPPVEIHVEEEFNPYE